MNGVARAIEELQIEYITAIMTATDTMIIIASVLFFNDVAWLSAYYNINALKQ
jgi:hypothetical protein